MKPYLNFTPGRQMWRVVLAVSLALTLTACFGEDGDGKGGVREQTDTVGYVAINHTDKSIVSIIINGEGGILGADAQGGGGEMCCVVLPHKWRPGLMATIKWQGGGTYQRDKKGNIVTNDGVPVVIEDPWKTKTVEVPEYKGEDVHGQLHIHFFPNDEVKVLRSVKGILQPEYPIPFPVKPTSR